MVKKEKLSRRHFVQFAVIGTGSICFLPQCTQPKSKWRFFTDAEAKVIDAVAEQIIPSDDWPGGREAGVTNFIDKQLVGPYKRFQHAYRKGIAAIQETCEARFQKKFEDLAWDDQTVFLLTLEAGNMKDSIWEGGFDQEFFNMIRNHSMQAYYGSSRHGGNKNYVSFKMLNLDTPLIVGQNRYKT
jgi:gluconate 2-dehydrogenase gamma chain